MKILIGQFFNFNNQSVDDKEQSDYEAFTINQGI